MTLSEIETILEELAARHQNLHSELLSTLLQSAGWEDKNIKEALAIFKQKSVGQQESNVGTTLPASLQANDVSLEGDKKENGELPEIKFYDTDGAEEKELHSFEDVAPIKEEKKGDSLVTKVASVIPGVVVVGNEAPLPQVNENKPKEEEILEPKREESTAPPIKKISSEPSPVKVEVSTHTTPSLIEKIVDAVSFIEVAPPQNPPHMGTVRETPRKEPQSLIVPKESLPSKVTKKSAEIPEDLPLLPFESSEQVWSFSKYKDTFHGEVIPKKEVGVVEGKKEQTNQPLPPQVSVKKVLVPEDDLEIDLEKTPMTRGDESLVFLAGVMLFAIILILGYMYSNGRL